MEHLELIKKMLDHDYNVSNDDAYYCLPVETLNAALAILREAGLNCRYLEDENKPLKPVETKPVKPEVFIGLSVNEIMSKIGNKL